jgi:nucleotide-binding universal stress UspA family protein
MFHRIVVPLDGSAFAEIAIPAALQLARRTEGARVHFIRVYEPRFQIVPSQEMMWSAEPDAALRKVASDYLAAVIERVRGDASVPITCELVDGSAGPRLVERIGAWTADLVVMTTHGRGPVSRFWLGSVADYVVRHTATPTLLLRPKDDLDWIPADLRIARILATTDFSPASDTILGPVAAFARLHGAVIELVHVVELALGYTSAVFPYPVPAAPELDEAARRIASEQLERRAAVLRNDGLVVTTNVLFGTGVASTILDRVRESTPDLVALATHGRTGWRRAVVGSVADKLIRGSGGAVLLIGAPAEPATASTSTRAAESTATTSY